jgi:hypothetical protein
MVPVWLFVCLFVEGYIHTRASLIRLYVEHRGAVVVDTAQ